MAISFGLPLNSPRPSSTDATRFELLGPGPKDVRNLPLALDGLTRGLGTQGVVGGVYPAVLDDGYFLAEKTFSGADYGADATVGGPFRPARGTEFYDYAADATLPVWLYFGANASVISGPNSNNPTLADGTTPNPDYEPGAYHSEAITGFQGIIDAWVPLRCVQEANLSGYTPGVELTVQKGRLKIAASGDTVVGTVEKNYNNTRAKIKFTLVGALKVKA